MPQPFDIDLAITYVESVRDMLVQMKETAPKKKKKSVLSEEERAKIIGKRERHYKKERR